MTFTFIHLLGAFGAGVVAAIAGFVWVNRNKADELDAAEGKIRDFKKPGA